MSCVNEGKCHWSCECSYECTGYVKKKLTKGPRVCVECANCVGGRCKKFVHCVYGTNPNADVARECLPAHYIDESGKTPLVTCGIDGVYFKPKNNETTVQENKVLNFGQALSLMKEGKKVRRKGWLPSSLSLGIVDGGFWFTDGENAQACTWCVDEVEIDILSNDWEVV